MLEVEKVDKAVTPQHLVGQVGGAGLVGIWMLFSHLQNIAAITSSFQVWIFQCRNQHFKLSSLELCCQSALSLPPGSPQSRTWWCKYEYILLWCWSSSFNGVETNTCFTWNWYSLLPLLQTLFWAKESQKDKKESMILCQGSFALLPCFYWDPERKRWLNSNFNRNHRWLLLSFSSGNLLPLFQEVSCTHPIKGTLLVNLRKVDEVSF